MKYLVTFSARKQPSFQILGIGLPTETQEVKVIVETSENTDSTTVEVLARLAYGRDLFPAPGYIDHKVEVQQAP